LPALFPALAHLSRFGPTMASAPLFDAASFFPPGAERYKVLKVLGSGAYGVVASCRDNVTQTT